MKFLLFFEKAWIVAAVASLVVMVYNLVALRTFDSRVYFPMLCGMFCILLWFNVRSQRKFRHKMQENKDK